MRLPDEGEMVTFCPNDFCPYSEAKQVQTTTSSCMGIREMCLEPDLGIKHFIMIGFLLIKFILLQS